MILNGSAHWENSFILLISPNTCTNLIALMEAWMEEVLNIAILQVPLERVHHKVVEINDTRFASDHNGPTTTINVLRGSVALSDCDIVRSHAKRNNKLQSISRGPIRLAEVKHDPVKVVEDSLYTRRGTSMGKGKSCNRLRKGSKRL